jgi:transposase
VTNQKRKRYSGEFKREAVELVVGGGYTVAEASRNLGLLRGMLGRWRKEQISKPQDTFRGKGHQPSETEELRRLRDENRRLKIEREILKKAAAFFAKESG